MTLRNATAAPDDVRHCAKKCFQLSFELRLYSIRFYPRREIRVF